MKYMISNKLDNRVSLSLKSLNKNKAKLYIILSILIIICILSIFASDIAPHHPYTIDLLNTLKAPSREFPFGTDSLGRDVYSRILYGASKTIFSALIVVSTTFVFGTFVGMVSGYFGGKFDRVVMRIVDVFLAFPGLVLAIAVAGILGGGIINAMIAIGAIGWTKYARISRSKVLELKEETFIQASKISGHGPVYIMFKHIIPNIVGYLIVTASLDIGTYYGNVVFGVFRIKFSITHS